LTVAPHRKFQCVDAEAKALPTTAVQRELQSGGISRQVVQALIVRLRAPVGQPVAIATPEDPLPRQIKSPNPPSAATQEPEPLASEQRPHSRDGNKLFIDWRADSGALATDIDRQPGWSSVFETAF
jgi:hypothetical protein